MYPFFFYVMGEYKKITKKDIDFPNYCFFFIKEIKESLDEYDVNDVGDELTLELTTSKYPYCYDALELVARTFKRLKYSMSTTAYKTSVKDGVKKYTYTWKITKIGEFDNLPF